MENQTSTRIRGNLPVLDSSNRIMWYEKFFDGSTYSEHEYEEIPLIEGVMDAEIIDQYEPFGQGVWHYKPVVHRKLKMIGSGDYNHAVSIGTVDTSCYTDPSVSLVDAYIGRDAPLHWYLNQSIGDFKTYLTKSHISDLARTEDLTRLAGRLEGKLPSMANGAPDLDVFLAELSDIKSIATGIVKSWRLLSKSVIRALASANLTYAFAIAPTVGDIRKLISRISKYSADFTKLKEGVGKVHETHASYKVADPVINNWTGNQPASSNGWCGSAVLNPAQPCPRGAYLRVDSASTYKYAVSVKYRYSLPEYLFEWSENLAVFLAAIGFEPGLSTIWELIPFSFVIDWVLNVGNAIPDWSLSPYPITVDIIDICVSLKYEEVFEWEYYRPCFEVIQRCPLMTFSQYERVTGEDASALLSGEGLKLEWPSFVQFLLGASLLLAGDSK